MTRFSTIFILLFVLAPAIPAGAREAPVLLVLGDSLSAAYGIDAARGWVALLDARLREQGYPHQVINASISGETTSGGQRRLPSLLAEYRPALVVVELGANDGLRGFPLTEIRDNLVAMVSAVEAAGARALVVRIEVPPNYGQEYTQGFTAIYDSLPALPAKPVLAPFFLAEVILEPELMQTDGLHPTAEAQPRLLDSLWPTLAPMLSRVVAGHE